MGRTLTEPEPWWAPLRKALVKKAADLILSVSFDPPEQKPVVVEAQFEDLPKKASRKRGKALPARSRARDDYATGETEERKEDAVRDQGPSRDDST